MKFNGHDRYSTTKLLDVFLARKIAQLPKVAASGVVVNSVNPSLCESDLGRDLQGEAAARFR
jgi:NAD(P)-dependent dehydrogenase (short-subunit alcohol dehydrogenase family)